MFGNIVSALSLLIAVFATFYIPKKMMNNQIYADLMSEYRKPEIGEAIIAVIDFYTTDCKSDVEMIEKEYVERYKTDKQNGKYENSLHFQRRLLSQYYYQLAALRYQGGWFTRLAKEKVREDFTAREAKLLSLLFLPTMTLQVCRMQMINKIYCWKNSTMKRKIGNTVSVWRRMVYR